MLCAVQRTMLRMPSLPGPLPSSRLLSCCVCAPPMCVYICRLHTYVLGRMSVTHHCLWHYSVCFAVMLVTVLSLSPSISLSVYCLINMYHHHDWIIVYFFISFPCIQELVNTSVVPAVLVMAVGLLSVSSLLWGGDVCHSLRRGDLPFPHLSYAWLLLYYYCCLSLYVHCPLSFINDRYASCGWYMYTAVHNMKTWSGAPAAVLTRELVGMTSGARAMDCSVSSQSSERSVLDTSISPMIKH
jgi:hypothetical protein